MVCVKEELDRIGGIFRIHRIGFGVVNDSPKPNPVNPENPANPV
jgi:hypothetical protein